MLQWILKKVVGSKNQREIKRLWPKVLEINSLEEELQKQPESVLLEKTAHWKAELAAIRDKAYSAIDNDANAAIAALNSGDSPDTETIRKIQDIHEKARKKKVDALEEVHAEQNAYLDRILPEAFAVVKNAARRLAGNEFIVCDQPMGWEMVHFDVQLIGGMALHMGRIAEMATGEGKTLVGTLPVYLNALTGRGVHIITVNDYLARRDSEWMGILYKYLGLTVGCIQNDQPPPVRRQQYQCDITYGTNSEFGFDYLRDNGMASSKDEQVQRGHFYAVIDEVDSVLIDEARTPLIISGPVTVDTHQYDVFKPLVDQLVKRQAVLLNEVARDAKAKAEAGDIEEAGHLMFKIKLGQPRHRTLMRMMEDPDMRRAMDKAELTYYQDNQKTALFALKEELYYIIDEKSHDADLSEKGRTYLNPDDPDAFVLPDITTAFSEIDGNEDLSAEAKAQQKEKIQERMDMQAQRMHNISQLLKAYCVYERDVHYVVEDNKVMIVDENTGRKMAGRRWSDGLHQAVEAKEGVKIDKETQTLATITIQNYFRLYDKLSGMTGTAETEAAEFSDIYGLDLLVIPTNRPVLRQDMNDKIFKTRREKYAAVIALLKERNEKGQPILVGTASVESSETLSRMMKREKIPHNVLNAKYHRQEAEIVQSAGLRGAVTVSTNMAGRGTDIKLGQGVSELGGLLVLGTERHESRRIDRQLRGRCARQGDPGESIFFISFEDDLMRNFGASERMTRIMERFGLEEGQELESSLLNKSVENAQKKVEQRNYTWRKRVLDFDDVMNQQREVVYGYRNEVLETENPRELLEEAMDEAIPAKTFEFLEGGESPDYGGLLNWVNTTFPLRMSEERADFASRDVRGNASFIIEQVKAAYDLKTRSEVPDALTGLERWIVLNAIDRRWQRHLYGMDSLREGVSLRSYGQKDPLIEYKNEAYKLFEELMTNIKEEVLHNLFRSTTNLQAFEHFLATLPQHLHRGAQGGVQPPTASPAGVVMGGGGGSITMSSPQTSSGVPAAAESDGPKIKLEPVRREMPVANRNDPCPCGSGKKFKQCCGRTA
ncbi:MAG: preprotein translocase subunit SecA [Verrucomicrobiae bacterium]|nr:preprotein translocase subunit SecA [Verrucomicrobiae bacterium]